ncbi:MAG TPA: hypothetical protein VKY54_15820 [Kiloniellales bacterium]|nr:hypothetical protein [Kiloniellales bacterium]
MKPQATRATPEQIDRAIKRQRAGLGPELRDVYPVLDAILGGAMLAAFFGSMITAWIFIGAGQ